MEPLVTESLQVEFAAMMNEAGIDRVMALDTSLRIVVVNRMWEDYTGLTRGEMISRRFVDVFPEAQAWPAIGEAMQHGLEGRRSYVPAEAGACEPGHHERHFIPLRNVDGSIQGVLYIIHDVSHRVVAEDKLKALNRELNQKLRELQRANADLATFTHVTSHDLKEPLRKIYTFVELTITEEHGRLSDKGRSNLRRVQSSVQRMGLLTDDLVMFAEVSAGDEEAEWLDLNQILSEAQKPLQKAIGECGAQLESTDLPSVFLPRRQAILLIQHLLANAVKFVAPGTKPKVRLECITVPSAGVPVADAAETDYWCIRISDNGIGIESEYQQRIFMLFQRLHGKGEYGGTGIGLAVCKKIVERLGGFITVESKPGKGSCFSCWIPVAGNADIQAVHLAPEAETSACPTIKA